MQIEVKEPGALWREDSAVWEIIAGELILQQGSSEAASPRVLLEEAQARATDAATLTRADDLDNAGHAMIGCALALAMAARAEAPRDGSAASYAADLAVDIAWAAQEPGAGHLDRLAEEIRVFAGDDQPNAARGVMKLAIRAGGYAAGLSSHITRRRQRRDLVHPASDR